MLLTIIVPVFNEESHVCPLLEKLIALDLRFGFKKEIIVVDDGSTDSTATRIMEFARTLSPGSVRILQHDRNQGKGAAVRTGITHSIGDVLIIQDADLEYDPSDINPVLEPIASGREKIVYGSRILQEKALGRSGVCGLITGKHPHSYVLAYLGGVAITKWTNLLTGSKLTDEPTCYKCYHRSVLSGVSIRSDDFSWEPEITVKLIRRGHHIAEVPISYHPRKRSEGKKINWKHGVAALWTVFREAALSREN